MTIQLLHGSLNQKKITQPEEASWMRCDTVLATKVVNPDDQNYIMNMLYYMLHLFVIICFVSDERGKLRIDKSCASQAGCTQAEIQLGKKYFCDKSRNGWGCVECCDRDRCNESAGVQIQPSIMMVCLIGATTLLLMSCR